MPKAYRSPSRRAVLGAPAAAPLAAVPAIACKPSADAKAIRLCAKLDRLTRQRIALFYGPEKIADDDERDALQEPIDEAQEPLLARLCAMECRTPAGIVAKLVTLSLMCEDMAGCPADEGYDDQRLLASALRDALRISGVEVTPNPPLVDALESAGGEDAH